MKIFKILSNGSKIGSILYQDTDSLKFVEEQWVKLHKVACIEESMKQKTCGDAGTSHAKM